MKTLILNTDDLWSWVMEAGNREACGIVCAGTAYRLPNRAQRPINDFKITVEDLEAFYDENPGITEVSGVWHSHPLGQDWPSEADKASHPQDKIMWIVTRKEIVGFECVAGGYVEVKRIDAE